MRVTLSLSVLWLAMVGGCGVAMVPPSASAPVDFSSVKRSELAQAADAPAAGGADAAQALKRKIVYNAKVDLVVEDFSDVPQRIDKLVTQFNAIVADSNVRGASGSPRRGMWKLRVPTASFDAFLAEVRKLGELTSEGRNSEDVSERYYDLTARIRNKKLQEERLLKMMEENAGKLDQLLSIEEHVTRVRGEIEQMEGQLRVLSDLADLATVTLQIDEVKGYVPPQAPTFTARVGRSWNNSLGDLSWIGQGLSVGVVYLAPWLAIAAIPFYLVYRVLKRALRNLVDALRPRNRLVTDAIQPAA
ncbi:MAG: DUF4349 domain-containing protein [Planctomycetia bacterium]|nr:DUF4349 domain-containing protein [Planctomycetia bacterium]